MVGQTRKLLVQRSFPETLHMPSSSEIAKLPGKRYRAGDCTVVRQPTATESIALHLPCEEESYEIFCNSAGPWDFAGSASDYGCMQRDSEADNAGYQFRSGASRKIAAGGG